MDAELAGVVFAVFDIVLGPKIVSQTPRALVSADQFDAISDYVIAKPCLCGRLVSVALPPRAAGGLDAFAAAATAPDDVLRLVGFPQVIEHRKYPRNSLFFNVAFVLRFPREDGADADPALLPPSDHAPHLAVVGDALRKLGRFLCDLEAEEEFLSAPRHRVRRENSVWTNGQ